MRTLWSAAALVTTAGAVASPAIYPYNPAQWATTAVGANPICRDGKSQSPIDFTPCTKLGNGDVRPAIATTWQTQLVSLGNTETTLRISVNPAVVNGPGKMSVVWLGSQIQYTLIQCDFHAGSEHTVGGYQLPMEMQCLHTKDGTPGVYGAWVVFFDIGSNNNSFLMQFENALVTTALSRAGRRLANNVSSYTGPCNFSKLYREVDQRRYWSYSGSLTQPPCTEGVDYFVFQNPVFMSSSQLSKFRDALGWRIAGGNFRPPQEIGWRTVYGCGLQPQPQVIAPLYPYNAESWGMNVGLNSNKICQYGQEQSPVNFPDCAERASRPAIDINWPSQVVDIINTGLAIRIVPKNLAPGTMVAANQTYRLVHCEYHVTSEHTIGGVAAPMEMDCVHTRDASIPQRWGVFSLMYRMAVVQDPFLTYFEDRLPSKGLPGTEVMSSYHGPLALQAIYGQSPRTRYWTYPGSFTTPPCTEAVDYFVLMDLTFVTQVQVDKFKIALGWYNVGGNFRPPQPLAGRIVDGCNKIVDSSVFVEAGISDVPQYVADAVMAGLHDKVEDSLNDRTNLIAPILAAASLMVLLMLLMLVMIGLITKASRNVGHQTTPASYPSEKPSQVMAPAKSNITYV